MRSSKIYLCAYNAAQALGWTALLIHLANQARQRDWKTKTQDTKLAIILQSAAILEVLHSAIGLVRSGTLTSFMQWAGRTHVIFAIVSQIRPVQRSSWLFVMLLAWSLSEIIRYPQYLLSTMEICPKYLTWLRYTAFILLYPVGVAAEMMLMNLSLPYVKKRNMYSSLFQLAKITYYDFLNVLLMVYPVLAVVLYRHMLRQRASKVRPRKAKSN